MSAYWTTWFGERFQQQVALQCVHTKQLPLIFNVTPVTKNDQSNLRSVKCVSRVYLKTLASSITGHVCLKVLHERMLMNFIFWTNVNWTFCIPAWWTYVWTSSFWSVKEAFPPSGGSSVKRNAQDQGADILNFSHCWKETNVSIVQCKGRYRNRYLCKG